MTCPMVHRCQQKKVMNNDSDNEIIGHSCVLINVHESFSLLKYNDVGLFQWHN